MESKLIILRGNSGSGKTTIAKSLQNQLGNGTLLVPQDTVRRDMLMVHDRKGNLSIDLIRQITEYGKGKCEYVILEGIFHKELYADMINHLIQFYNDKAYVYYFDLSFEETVRRHNSRPKSQEFGEELLRTWWKPADYLGVEREQKLTEDLSQDDILRMILEQLHNQ